VGKKYKRAYASICDKFLAPLFNLIFHIECPRITEEAKGILKYIGNWYLQEKFTYFRIYGVVASPHLLPIYVPNKLVLSEIAYQTILQGFNSLLVKDVKKKLFIPYNFYVGYYKNFQILIMLSKKGNLMLEFIFQQGQFRRHDPQGLVPKYCNYISWPWHYTHEICDDELIYQDIDSWNEVEGRLKNKEAIIFYSCILGRKGSYN
jgi:hypothetical protein